MSMLGVLILFIGVWVGIRILWEVKGEHFADDTISLLWMEERKGQFSVRSNLAFNWTVHNIAISVHSSCLDPEGMFLAFHVVNSHGGGCYVFRFSDKGWLHVFIPTHSYTNFFFTTIIESPQAHNLCTDVRY